VQDRKHKVIVITGAAGGIGRALALHGARLGMRVVLSDIDAGRLEQTVAEVTALGAEAIGVPADVASAESVVKLADAAYARFGAVHVLVNNAGIAASGAAWQVPLEMWDRTLRINLDGVVFGIHAFVPRMLAGGEPGHIVNVASAAGLVTTPGFAAYSASKFAVVGLSEALYYDLKLRKAPIGVSLLCPAWVKTDIATSEHAAVATDDPIDTMVEASVRRAVSKGMPADEVAAQVFAAIENDQFYIITHAETRKAHIHRADGIAHNRNPEVPSFERRPSQASG
jgi:NAD(P)-dependent dehydrogenase (short-subunit alcohol dehydrogenase family)